MHFFHFRHHLNWILCRFMRLYAIEYCEMSYRRNKVRRKYFRYCYSIFNVIAFTQILCRRFFSHIQTKMLRIATVYSSVFLLYLFAKCIEKNGTDINCQFRRPATGNIRCASRCERRDIVAVCRYSVFTIHSTSPIWMFYWMRSYFLIVIVSEYCRRVCLVSLISYSIQMNYEYSLR